MHARNFPIAVFYEDRKEFYGIRYKFGEYLSPEYHYDQDDTHGTVKPIKYLELYKGECDHQLFNWLSLKRSEYINEIENMECP